VTPNWQSQAPPQQSMTRLPWFLTIFVAGLAKVQTCAGEKIGFNYSRRVGISDQVVRNSGSVCVAGHPA
jgi:hypothetical protein